MSNLNTLKNINILVIDRGNTFVKIALFKYHKLHALKVFDTLDRKSLLDYKQSLESQFNLSITHAILSSVVLENEEIKQMLDTITTFIDLSAETPTPIINKYSTPETLGNDRIAAVAGACSAFPNQDLLIIDAGSPKHL